MCSTVTLLRLVIDFPMLLKVFLPEAAPLATACSHLTALFFREGEETTAEDLLGLRLPASSCIRVKGLPVLVTDEGVA